MARPGRRQDRVRTISPSSTRILLTGATPGLGRPEGAGRAEARPFHHDLMGPVGEAIKGAVGEDGVVQEGDPSSTARLLVILWNHGVNLCSSPVFEGRPGAGPATLAAGTVARVVERRQD